MKQLTLLFLLLSSVVFGQKGKAEFNQFFEIDNGHSYVEFSVKYMGYAKVRGRFSEFSGLLRYDKSNVENTSVTLAVKSESINTDVTFRDNDLKSDNWFDTKKFPIILFSSKGVKTTKDGFDLTGDLTLKGVTREIVLHMAPASGVLKDIRGDMQVIFSGTMTIDRTQFGVEGKNWSVVKEGIAGVASQVDIEVSMLGKQLQIANFSNRVKNPQNPPGKLYKLIQEQGVDAGLEEFKKMLAANTVKLPALDIVGYMLRLEGKYAEAIRVYEANKAAFPETTEVYYSLGEVYFMKGDVANAKINFEEAVKKDPENVSAIEYLRDLH